MICVTCVTRPKLKSFALFVVSIIDILTDYI